MKLICLGGPMSGIPGTPSKEGVLVLIVQHDDAPQREIFYDRRRIGRNDREFLVERSLGDAAALEIARSLGLAD